MVDSPFHRERFQEVFCSQLLFIRILMNTYKHIVFDIDGTMLNSAQAMLKSLQDTLATLLHRTFTDEELHFVLSLPGRDALKRVGFVDPEPVLKLWNHNLTHYKSWMYLFDGIPELLRDLAVRGNGLGIITSKTRSEIENDFAPFGMMPYFQTIICVDDVSCPKPSPEPLLAYCSQTKLSPRDLFYIGDMECDGLCAQSAGVDFGLAAWAHAEIPVVPSTVVLQSPADVRKFLLD